MTVIRDPQGRQIVRDRCPGCGKLTKRLPRTGKARYRPRCSHSPGAWCPWGERPNNMHINNYPLTGGCPVCRIIFREAARLRRA